MPPARASRRSDRSARQTLRLAVLLIVSAGVCTYANGLGGPFIWDDDTAIVKNPTLQHLSTALSPPPDTSVAARLLVNLSLAINYAIGGLRPVGYHAINIAIHIACALVLFGAVRRTLRKFDWPAQPGASAGDNGILSRFSAAELTALVIALLWMVHPLQTEVVDYITQRSESLMGLFFLLTVYCAMRARDVAIPGVTEPSVEKDAAQISAAPGRRRTARAAKARQRSTATAPLTAVHRWQVAAIVACACGMLSKETMVVAPLIVVLYDWSFEFASLRDALRARSTLYGGLAATWLILGAILWSVPHPTTGASATIGAWTYLLNQVQVIGHYLLLSVWPRDLVLDYGLPRALQLRDVWPGAVAIVLLLAASVVALLRWRRIGFLAVSVFLILAPTSSFIPITTEVGAARRMYVPLAALVILAVMAARAGLDGLRARLRASSSEAAFAGRLHSVMRVAPSMLTVAVLLALAGRTIARNGEYADPLRLWRADVERWPHGRSRMALGGELIGVGQDAEAAAVFRKAIEDFPDARLPLGAQLILQQRQYADGIEVLRGFLAGGPSRPKRRAAHTLMAQAFAEQNELDKAGEEWRAVLADAPGDAEASGNLAHIRSTQAQAALQRGEAARAEAYAREAVQLAPADADARKTLEAAAALKKQTLNAP